MLVVKRLFIISLLGGHPAVALAQDGADFSQDDDIYRFLADEQQMTVETATSTKSSLDFAPASMTVITREQIRTWGVRTLTDLVRFVPGIYSSLDRDGLRRIHSRGRVDRRSNGVKILINGHSVNEPFSGSALPFYDDRPLDDVKQIEIIRGPGSALYGANAFVAVINILTRDDSALNSEVRYDTEHSPFVSAYASDTFLGIKAVGHASFIDSQGAGSTIEADRLHGTRDVLQSLAPGPTDQSYQRVDADLSLEWKWLSATARFLRKRRGEFAGSAYYLSYDPDNPEGSSNLGYQHMWAEIKADVPIIENRVRVVAKLFYDDMEQDINLRQTKLGFRIFEDLDGDGEDEIFPEGMRLNRFMHHMMGGFEGQTIITPFAGNELVLGYVHQFHRQNRAFQRANFNLESRAALPGGMQDVGDFTEPSYTREIVAGYIEDVWQVVDALSLTAGLRVDRYSDFGTAFSPRAAVVYNPMEGLFLKGLFGRAFRAPTFDELFTRGGIDVIGNPTLGPEVLDTGELAAILRLRNLFSLGRRYLVDSFTAKATGFVTNISGAIEPGEPVALTGPGRLRNSGELRIMGGEFELALSLARLVTLSGNFTYQHAANRDAPGQLPNVPTWLGNIQLFVSPLEWVYVGAGAHLIGARGRFDGDNPVGASGERLFPNRPVPLPAQADLWAVAGMRGFRVGPVSVGAFVRVENLLGADLRDPSPPLRAFGDLTFPQDYPRPGRTIIFGVDVDFPLSTGG